MAAARSAPSPKRPGINWDQVLSRLPRSFSLEDLRKSASKLIGNPQPGFMALARWTRAKQIKKDREGQVPAALSHRCEELYPRRKID